MTNYNITYSPPTRHVVSTWNEALNEQFPEVLEYRAIWRELGYDVQITPNADIRSDVVRLQQDESSKDADNFLKVFDSLETTNLQFDFWRYTKLYLDGGIYADVDVKPLAEILKWDQEAQQHKSVVVFEESPTWTRNSSLAKFFRPIISNYPDFPAYASCIVIAPEPRMRFFLDLLRKVDPVKWRHIREPRRTLMTVGPGLLTAFVGTGRDDVILVTKSDGKQAYIHTGFGTWKPKATLAWEQMTTSAWEQMRLNGTVVVLVILGLWVMLEKGRFVYRRRRLAHADRKTSFLEVDEEVPESLSGEKKE